MITITPIARKNRKVRAFTLIEVMVSMTLTVIAMAGVLSSIIMMARSSYTVTNYADMEAESRRGLERFAQDVRSAQSITWNSTTSITLTVPTGDTTNPTYTCTYGYDSYSNTFSRFQGSQTTVLFTGIQSGTFELKGYKIGGITAVDLTNLVIASNDTKQIQLSLATQRTRATVGTTTQKVISARFILRNKPVTT
jgi:type II secretory pathway pseudopilin PulG